MNHCQAFQLECKQSDFKTYVQQTMKGRSLSFIEYLKHFLFKTRSSEPNIVSFSQNTHKRWKIHVFQ